MNSALIIARREYLVRIRTWSFWLLTLLVPLVAAGGLYVCLLSAGGSDSLDFSAALQEPMVQQITISMLTVVISIAYGYTLLSNLMEDRQSGMEELLLRCTRQWAYFLGKTLGVLSVALTQWAAWSLITGLMGWTGAGIGSSGILLSALPYVLLGYTVNALIAYLTSRCTRSQARARQMMAAVIVLELLPLECNMLLLQHPDGLLAHLLTAFPLTTAGTLPFVR